MNENTQKLVKALRSGKYSQASGSLRTADGHCCLGVACSVSDLGRWDKHPIVPGSSELEYDYSYKIPGEPREGGILPDRVRQWLGWESHNGQIPHPTSRLKGSVTNLAALNDGGTTFAQIADYIEQNYDYLVRGH